MPIQNQFRPTPAIDLPFLNAWRDKIVDTAHELNIQVPEQRELIDFEVLFNEIRDVSLAKRKKINDTSSKLDASIKPLTFTKYFKILELMKNLKHLVNTNIKNVF